MKKETESTENTKPKPSRGRGLAALMSGDAVVEKALPQDVRAELKRMSANGTEVLLQHMTYDEARELMRHGWPSHYFGHLQRIARKAQL